MLRKLGLILASVALFSIVGGHWGVLQSVAWAQMLRENIRHGGSIAEDAKKTFDGRHPCSLCLAIADARAKEHKEKSAVSGLDGAAKLKARTSDEPFRSRPPEPELFAFARGTTPSPADRAEQPPTPPPRRGMSAA